MALQTDTVVSIAEKLIPTFNSLKLTQEIAAHHTLELECRMDVLEDITDELATNSKNFLGETITLQIAPYTKFKGYGSLRFKGIVTHVKVIKGHAVSTGDVVTIIAKSPTYITDDGAHYASYSDVALSEILETTFIGYDTAKLNVHLQPQNDSTLHYSVQQNESTFEYIKRLAAQTGEWLYYNGEKLIFGAPETEEIKLRYGYDLKEYELGLEPKSHNYRYFTDDYLLDEVHETDAKETSAYAGGYGDFVSNKAQTIYAKESKIWHQAYTDSNAQNRLDTSVALQKKAIEIQQVQVKGLSDNSGVCLGGIIVIEGIKYRVIKIEHTNNIIGDYINRFTAVSANFNAYPLTNIHAFPKSEPQTATVVDNNDPMGLGRVKVAFAWQKSLVETTPWLRIVTPHAGGNKGFHFIPEINEEVLIGFEGGNAERPYVMGSLYNGNQTAKAFNSVSNDFKVIRTRSGHTIELNDTEGKEFISISDKNSNLIQLNTNDSSIVISAPETLTFMSKNLDILVRENMSITTGKNKKENISGNHTLKATNIIQIANENIKNEADQIVQQASDTIDILASGNINKQADKKINNSSGEQSNLF